MPIPRLRRYLTPAAALFVALLIAACGAENAGERAQGASAERPPAESSTGGLAPELARNVAQADRIIGEGKEVFDRRGARCVGIRSSSTSGPLGARAAASSSRSSPTP